MLPALRHSTRLGAVVRGARRSGDSHRLSSSSSLSPGPSAQRSQSDHTLRTAPTARPARLRTDLQHLLRYLCTRIIMRTEVRLPACLHSPPCNAKTAQQRLPIAALHSLCSRLAIPAQHADTSPLPTPRVDSTTTHLAWRILGRPILSAVQCSSAAIDWDAMLSRLHVHSKCT